MNMTTSIQNIPMKTSKLNNNDIDDSEDPMVKDILQEFQEELKENQKSLPNPPSQNDTYQINYNPPPPPQQPPPQIQQKPIKNSFYTKYYNQEILIKTAIIITIIAFVFSPTIFNTFMDKIPYTLAEIFNQYDFYIKLIISFIFVYIYNIF